MDEKTLKKKIERIVTEIAENAYCYYCREGICFEAIDAEEAILQLVLELTKE